MKRWIVAIAAVSAGFAACGDDHNASDVTVGDLVVIPFTGTTAGGAQQICDAGRSVLAPSRNPGTQSALGGSTMSLPIGGTVNPT